MRRDLAQGYCLLEYYKDEKAAAKGAEAIKGFINVHDVVDVRRVPNKKQTFEILCPGVGYRLMANSEVEADEWTGALKKLTLYRKDNLKPLSLQRTTSSPTDPSEQSRDQRKRTLSDSSSPMTHQQQNVSLTHPKSLAIPESSSSPSRPQAIATDIPTVNLSHSLPTPPEIVGGTPSLSPPTPPPTSSSCQPPPTTQILSKSAAELRAALPSPSTSSDSSSMCSGSNTSFDNQSTFEGGERNDSSM